MKNLPITSEELRNLSGGFYETEQFPNRAKRRSDDYPNSTKMAKCSAVNPNVIRKNKYIQKRWK